jgi:uncharacterized glyoxalase superfamily protein PhnB
MEEMRAHRTGVRQLFFLVRTLPAIQSNEERTMSEATAGKTVQIKKLTPNLVVRDVQASLLFYREVLGLETGFTVPDQVPFVFGSVTNGVVEVFFNEQKTVAAEYPKLAATIGGSLTLYMEVSDLKAVLERVQKRGAKISMPVAEQFYGMREFAFEDVDGYTITIAEKI